MSGKVINKTVMFVVKFAKNTKHLSRGQRDVAMEGKTDRTKGLINRAVFEMNKKKGARKDSQ